MVTFFNLVNKYASGKTKTNDLNKEIINGTKAYPSDWRIPWIATEMPININLDILRAFIQTVITSVVALLDKTNNFAKCCYHSINYSVFNTFINFIFILHSIIKWWNKSNCIDKPNTEIKINNFYLTLS